MTGFFISFEGIEGSGKSTQVTLLAQVLRSQGHEVVVTREPGGTAVGQVLRRLLLESASTLLASGTELLLMLADRAQHVQEVVAPALLANKIVICDRFVDSTTAYQGYGRGVEFALLAQLNAFACRGCMPALTLVLDLPVSEGLHRVRQRQSGTEGTDRFEAESVAFHERVRTGFLEVARAEPQRVHLLEATRPVEVIHQEILTVVQARLALENLRPLRLRSGQASTSSG
jgi:dTMP kinase